MSYITINGQDLKAWAIMAKANAENDLKEHQHDNVDNLKKKIFNYYIEIDEKNCNRNKTFFGKIVTFFTHSIFNPGFINLSSTRKSDEEIRQIIQKRISRLTIENNLYFDFCSAQNWDHDFQDIIKNDISHIQQLINISCISEKVNISTKDVDILSQYVEYQLPVQTYR